MQNFNFYKEKLLQKYKTANNFEIEERYFHSLNVAKKAEEIVKQLSLPIDIEKVRIAGLLHDYAKFMNKEEFEEIVLNNNLSYEYYLNNEKVTHALLGKYAIMNDLGIEDEEILNAIEYHTTGRANMSLLEEVIFLSDYIEDSRVGRNFEKVRNIAQSNYQKAIYIILEENIKKLTTRNAPIHTLTMEAFQYYKKFYNTENSYLNNILETINRNLVHNISIYDASKSHLFCDYVIVSTALSERQMQAAINYLRQEYHIRGIENGKTWTLIDLGDIIIHIFSEEDRLNYGLDRLYSSLPQIPFKS